MKNTNDLRRLLGELADETPEVPTQEWLAGTRQKVRVRRRARVAGAVGAVALVLAAAVAVVPRVVDDASPEPVDPPPKPTDSREWDFPAGTEVRRIVDSRLNAPGESSLDWNAKTSVSPWNLTSMQFCHLPAGWPSTLRSEIRAVWSVDGRRIQARKCGHLRQYPPVYGRLVSSNLVSMAEYGIERREPFSISMWLERAGDPIDVRGAEFGFALFTCGAASADDGDGCRMSLLPVPWSGVVPPAANVFGADR